MYYNVLQRIFKKVRKDVNILLISIRISEEDKSWIEKYASAHDLSMSQVVRKAIKYFIQRQESK